MEVFFPSALVCVTARELLGVSACFEKEKRDRERESKSFFFFQSPESKGSHVLVLRRRGHGRLLRRRLWHVLGRRPVLRRGRGAPRREQGELEEQIMFWTALFRCVPSLALCRLVHSCFAFPVLPAAFLSLVRHREPREGEIMCPRGASRRKKQEARATGRGVCFAFFSLLVCPPPPLRRRRGVDLNLDLLDTPSFPFAPSAFPAQNLQNQPNQTLHS